MPTVCILAGPNGPGKTTAAGFLLPEVFGADIFINADIIAAQLSPRNPEAVAFRAGRIILERVQETVASKQMAKERVTLRVSKGGHNIPPDVIERRYAAGITNFFIAF